MVFLFCKEYLPYLFLGEFNRHAAFVSISVSGQQYSRLNRRTAQLSAKLRNRFRKKVKGLDMWRKFCFFAVCIPKFCSMMNENNKFVRFDWAAKRMLRDKANFGVLEGLLTVLLGEKITIEQNLSAAILPA